MLWEPSPPLTHNIMSGASLRLVSPLHRSFLPLVQPFLTVGVCLFGTLVAPAHAQPGTQACSNAGYNSHAIPAEDEAGAVPQVAVARFILCARASMLIGGVGADF